MWILKLILIKDIKFNLPLKLMLTKNFKFT